MDISRAKAAAEHLVELLAPGCERLEVGGSVRRMRQFVGDLELVLVPKFENEAVIGQLSLMPPSEDDQARYAPDTVRVPVPLRLLEEHTDLLVPIKSGNAGRRRQDHEDRPDGLKMDAKVWRLWMDPPGLVVECYVATPETWGLALMVRTGSADFSRGLYARWKRLEGGQGYGRDLRWHDHDGKVIDTPEERDVFKAVQLQWLEPWEREHDVEMRGGR